MVPPPMLTTNQTSVTGPTLSGSTISQAIKRTADSMIHPLVTNVQVREYLYCS